MMGRPPLYIYLLRRLGYPSNGGIIIPPRGMAKREKKRGVGLPITPHWPRITRQSPSESSLSSLGDGQSILALRPSLSWSFKMMMADVIGATSSSSRCCREKKKSWFRRYLSISEMDWELLLLLLFLFFFSHRGIFRSLYVIYSMGASQYRTVLIFICRISCTAAAAGKGGRKNPGVPFIYRSGVSYAVAAPAVHCKISMDYSSSEWMRNALPSSMHILISLFFFSKEEIS